MSYSRKPTPDDLKQARGLVQSDPILLHRFFRGLENPHWARPLLEAGVLDWVPSDGKSENSRYGRDSSWPASPYVIRIARGNPGLLRDVIERPKLQHNLHVRAALLVAIGKLTARDALTFVPNLVEWTKDIRRIHNGGVRFADIVLGLLGDGQEGEARKLAEKIWSLPAPISQNEKEGGENDLARGGYPRSTGIMSENDFMRSINRVSPKIIAEQPCEGLCIFIKVLIDCIQLERSQRQLDQSTDYSFVWRSAIEPHPQNGPMDWRDVVIDVVRDSAVECCKDVGSNSEALEKVIYQLQQFDSPIFQRIAFHVCRQFPIRFCASSNLVRDMFSMKWFRSPYVHHELYMLVQDILPKLSKDQKTALASNWVEAFREDSTSKQSDQVRIDVLRWFGNIEEHVPDMLRPMIVEARAAGGTVPDHPEFGIYVESGFLGRRSPFSSSELNSMPIPEMLEVLRNWQPSGHPLEDTPIHLAETIADMENRKIVELLKYLPDCIDLDVTYWVGIIRGIQRCTQENILDDEQWREVTEFVCRISTESASRPDDIDTWLYHHPAAAQRYAGDLLRDALSRDLLNLNLVPDAWRAIKSLIANAEPADWVESPDELFNLTLNSAYGVSLHCVVEFVHSVYRLLDNKGGVGTEYRQMTVDAWDIIAKHLGEPPATSDFVRAVCGGRMPGLHGINVDWVKANRKLIFPHGENEYDRWCMAWAPYVKYCHPHKGVTQFLHLEYEHAMNVRHSNPGTVETTEWWRRYIEHLCVMSVTGAIEEEPGGFATWKRFIGESGEASLHKAIGFIGRGLSHETSDPQKKALPDETIERAKRIWSGVLSELVNEPGGSGRKLAASAFGWWVTARQFDPNWMLRNLIEAIRIAGQIDDLSTIMEKLAKGNNHDGALLLQFMCQVVQNNAIDDLIPEDIYHIQCVFRQIGKQSHAERQHELKTCLRYFAGWDVEGFTALYNELCV